VEFVELKSLTFLLLYLCDGILFDTIQANKEMTKDSNYHLHYEKSSQLSSEDPTKDLADLTRRKNWQRAEYQMFFLMKFLRIKQIVNKLGSL